MPYLTGEAFPLRGFIACPCGRPLMGCFSTGRSGARFAYYLCRQKGCEHYGKSIRRDLLEGEFETLLLSLTPSRDVTLMATDMFRDLWNGRVEAAKESRRN